MKKGKIVLIVFLIILLLLAGFLFLRFYPAWKSAEVMEDRADLAHFSYELELELDKDELPKQYVEIFSSIAEIAKVDEDELYHLTAKGTVWEDITYVQIYFQNQTESLVEMYLSDEMDVINESKIYKAVRDNLVGRSELLAMLVPEGEDNVYMTLEQANQLFGIDLSGIANFSLPFTDMTLEQKEFFLALAVLSREKHENSELYELDMERIRLGIDVPKADSASLVEVHAVVQEPSVALTEIADLAAKVGVDLNIPVEELKVIKSLALDAIPEDAVKPTMPTNFLSQETINVLSEIAALIEQFAGDK